MLCSNCRIIEIQPGTPAPTTCENGHSLCAKCVLQAKDKCMLCAGQLYDSETRAWIRLQANKMHNWTPETIREWSKQVEYPDNLSSGSVSGDALALSDEYDVASMNLLYSRGTAYEIDSRGSDQFPVTEANWKQELALHSKDYGKIPATNQNKPFIVPENIAKSSCIDVPKLVKTNTRQNLVDQTKEEIRRKIMEEIFSSFKNGHQSEKSTKENNHIRNFNSIGVSTESTPRLLPEYLSSRSPQSSRDEIAKLTEKGNDQTLFPKGLQDCILMHMGTNSIPLPQISEFWKQNGGPPTEFKLPQVRDTIVETAGDAPPPLAEDQQFYRFLRDKLTSMPLANLEKILFSVYSGGDNLRFPELVPPSQKETAPTRTNESSLLSNSHRACYSKPAVDGPTSEEEPNPQFELITFRNLKVSEELHEIGIIDAGTLNIPRSPIICPISTCRRAFFVSDFTKHIAVDHTKVPFERILPRQYKNFLLDPKLIQYGVSRCQVLLLVRDKITNLGHEKFKDFIPILVMTTRLSLIEICSNKDVKSDAQNFIMIWLTGIMPPQLPIFFNLTVWARSGYRPLCHIVHSGRLYSVRNSQSPEAVRSSGQALMLSENQVDLLTNNGRHMLELQIAVH